MNKRNDEFLLFFVLGYSKIIRNDEKRTLG